MKKNGWDFLPKYGYEFRVVPEVYVGYVQDSYLVRNTLEMRVYVVAVDWFHDYDEVGPIDEFLRQWFALWMWHDSSGLCFPNPFPALKEALSCWATLQIRCANKEYFPHG